MAERTFHSMMVCNSAGFQHASSNFLVQINSVNAGATNPRPAFKNMLAAATL
jgi:hypothetical protein